MANAYKRVLRGEKLGLRSRTEASLSVVSSSLGRSADRLAFRLCRKARSDWQQCSQGNLKPPPGAAFRDTENHVAKKEDGRRIPHIFSRPVPEASASSIIFEGDRMKFSAFNLKSTADSWPRGLGLSFEKSGLAPGFKDHSKGKRWAKKCQ